MVIGENAVNITSEIPAEAIESLARCLLPEIQKYFESDEGKREFEEWKAKQTNQAVQVA